MYYVHVLYMYYVVSSHLVSVADNTPYPPNPTLSFHTVVVSTPLATLFFFEQHFKGKLQYSLYVYINIGP